VAGFWLFQVQVEGGVHRVGQALPQPHAGESEVEIRQVAEAADFGEAYTPEVKQQEDKVRDTIRARSS
jgi:hypothetical protein